MNEVLLVLVVVLATGIPGSYVIKKWVWRQVNRPPSHSPESFSPSLSDERPVVVCVGDSITHGAISANYVDMVADELGDTAFVLNAGINGELAYNLLRRIDAIIAVRPSVVTVMIGTNDANALLHGHNAKRSIKEHNLPEEPSHEWFGENLRAIATTLKAETDARIALLSIPPIGENRDHHAYAQSIRYGETIKKVAEETGVDYLPVGEQLRTYLDSHPSNPRLSPSWGRLPVVAMIIRKVMLKHDYQQISQSWGQQLLTDHLHLNELGAGIVAELVREYIMNQLNREETDVL